VPDAAHPPPGCHFHPRCRHATDRCRTESPALREVAPGRIAACHYAETLG
jgi:peptide/nickel transport system ATP-binding protein